MFRVGLIQADIKPHNKEGNLAHYAQWLKDEIREPVDLLVFPEVFHCGFSPEIASDGESDNGEGTRFLRQTAQLYHCNVVASLPILQDGKLYNRLLWFSPDQLLGCYDKRYLFIGEEEFFVPGTGKTIVNTLGYKFLPLICFDIRFPEWSRNHVTDGQFDYDCLVYTTNFPAPRESELLTLARARAIENQAYAIVVNRTGVDGHGRKHAGGCAVINPYGEIEVQTTSEKEQLLFHSCKFDTLKPLRELFPVSNFWEKQG